MKTTAGKRLYCDLLGARMHVLEVKATVDFSFIPDQHLSSESSHTWLPVKTPSQGQRTPSQNGADK